MAVRATHISQVRDNDYYSPKECIMIIGCSRTQFYRAKKNSGIRTYRNTNLHGNVECCKGADLIRLYYNYN